MPQAIQRAASLPAPEHVPPHPPAQKVAGRRMSVTARAKPHAVHHENKVAAAPVDDDEPAQTDYPRPAPPGEQASHEHHQHEEEQPRKDRRHAVPEYERRLQETAQRKAEMNRPTKDIVGGNKTAGIRISQPAGKALGA